MTEVRTERTFGVTGELKPLQRQHLLAFINSEVYPDVLDVMEMVCIEMETALINASPEDETAVLALHKKAQAAWQIFIHMQKKIVDEAKRHIQATAKEAPQPKMNPFEQMVENILDPTRPGPNEEDFTM